MQSAGEILQKLIAPSTQKEVMGWKVLSILFSVVSLGVIIYTREKTSWARIGFLKKWHEFRNKEALDKTKFEKRWETVKRRLEKEWESEVKLAIIETDEMLDELLKRLGYPGEKTEDKLEKVEEGRIENRAELAKARRLRNDIVHDPDYYLSLSKGEWALSVYENVFENLNAL